MKNEQEKSDLFIVAMKPANKPGRLGAEPVEPRERTEGSILGAPGSNLSPRGSGCYGCSAARLSHLLRLSRRGRCWGDVPHLHSNLPGIALANINF
jgi:hypothetical protein